MFLLKRAEEQKNSQTSLMSFINYHPLCNFDIGSADSYILKDPVQSWILNHFAMPLPLTKQRSLNSVSMVGLGNTHRLGGSSHLAMPVILLCLVALAEEVASAVAMAVAVGVHR